MCVFVCVGEVKKENHAFDWRSWLGCVVVMENVLWRCEESQQRHWINIVCLTSSLCEVNIWGEPLVLTHLTWKRHGGDRPELRLASLCRTQYSRVLCHCKQPRVKYCKSSLASGSAMMFIRYTQPEENSHTLSSHSAIDHLPGLLCLKDSVTLDLQNARWLLFSFILSFHSPEIAQTAF